MYILEKVYEFKQSGKFTVTLTDDYIVLKPHGFLNAMTIGFARGEKRILFADITAIQFKKPRLTNGYIQFAYNGSVESKSKSVLGSVQDENTLTFGHGEVDMANEIYDFIEKRRTEIKRGVSAPAPVIQTNVADEIRKFKELLDEGIITPEEFEEKKKQLLNV